MRAKTQAGAIPARNVLVGLAGWSYQDWNGIVYPTKRPRGFHEAAFLSQYFDTIEINTSFYAPLRPDSASHWIELISPNPQFQFTAKLWQKFTHETGATREDEKAVREGFDVLRAAGRLGAVLLQFSFSFHQTPENLARLKQLLDKFADYPLVVEVRHASWSQPEFYEFLRDRAVGICNIDQPVIGRSIKPDKRVTSTTGYFRLHGRRYDTWFSDALPAGADDDPEVPRHERYNYLYNEQELLPWADRVQNVAGHAKTTFVIANNHFQGKAAVNALQFIHLLTGAKVDVPDTLRSHYPQLDAIASAPAKEPTLFPLPPK
ncbi:MAG: DUF72 domain-containing protein [Candidatus Acidiferrales bacterium]